MNVVTQTGGAGALRPAAEERVAVIGLGYVGLPVAIALSHTVARLVGFDRSTERVTHLQSGDDRNGETARGALDDARIRFSADAADLAGSTIFIVTVPTPLDDLNRPDLSAVLEACASIGPHLSPGAIVVLESTVYPGVTEDVMGPALERASGLTAGVDFFLAYSPERINPGDTVHRLETITKVVAAQTPEALDRVAGLYETVVQAGVHRAASIKIAEAAKVIENTQRDINIALMNELSMICERLDIPTRAVLEAAGTKWNFLRFTPGLVGGHCIGVDPYYLAAKATQVGLHPEIILAGRRINDGMSAFVADRAVRMLTSAGLSPCEARVGVLGLTFKEDVPDMRNSRVPEVVHSLRKYGLSPKVHDPLGCPAALQRDYGLEMADLDACCDLHLLLLAVPHRAYLEHALSLQDRVRPGGILLDLKGALPRDALRDDINYWAM